MQKVDFQKYRDWLYSGHINFADAMEKDDFKPIIQKYLFSLAIRDSKFSTAILHSVIDVYTEIHRYPEQGAIALAYQKKSSSNTEGLQRLQRLLVETYAVNADVAWFENEEWNLYPHEFFCDITVGIFFRQVGKKVK